MSTGGNVDEKIRAVLDLGDSSGVVKALDAELDKLLDDFKKQTELFDKGKMSTREYTEALAKMKSEVGGVTGAIKDLGGGGSGGGGLESINRKLFALERGLTGLASGTGLGRAGSLLESGLSLFGSRAAGFGVTAALVANTVERIAPQIAEAFNSLYRQFTPQQVEGRIQGLAQQAEQQKEGVRAAFNRAVPGTEELEQDAEKLRNRLMNAGTRTGPRSLREGMLRAMASSEGNHAFDMSPEEKQKMREIMDQIDPLGAMRRRFEQEGAGAVGVELFSHVGRWWEEYGPAHVAGAQIEERYQRQLRDLKQSIIQRSVDRLLTEAMQGGPTGRNALKAIKDLIDKYPDMFNSGQAQAVKDLLEVLEIINQVGGGDRMGQSRAAVFHPKPEDIQREQQAEVLEQGRSGSRRRRESRQYQMFQAEFLQQVMEDFGNINITDPRIAKVLQSMGLRDWQAMTGHGPATRSAMEADFIGRARERLMLQLLGQHPEMPISDVQNMARAQANRLRESMFPQHHMRRVRRPAGRPHPNAAAGAAGNAWHPWLDQHGAHVTSGFVGPPAPSAQLAEINARATANREDRETIARERRLPAAERIRTQQIAAQGAARVQPMADAQNARRAEVYALLDRQQQALKLEEHGLQTHAKTQQVVRGIQLQIERLYGMSAALDRGADNLLRGQNRTQQIVTGHP